jgi:hypothetical protein
MHAGSFVFKRKQSTFVKNAVCEKRRAELGFISGQINGIGGILWRMQLMALSLIFAALRGRFIVPA